jgi:hypothetical protein
MDRSASIDIQAQNPQDDNHSHDNHSHEGESNNNTSTKKKTCCAGRWKPFFKEERDEPTMAMRTKGPGKTLYQKDYIKHPLNATRDMKNDLWTTFQNSEPMDFTTTMRNDFVAKKITHPVQSMAARPVTTHVPFGGKSSYRREYVDWKGNQAMMTMPVQPSTVVSNLPFLKRTTMRDDYQKPYKEDDLNDQLRAVNKQKKDSSIFPVMPLLGETTYQKHYKGFKVGALPADQRPQKDIYGNTAYPGQYESLAQAEYKDPRKRYACTYRDE